MKRSVITLAVLALLTSGTATACSKHGTNPPATSKTPASTAHANATPTSTAAAPKLAGHTGHTGDTLTLTRADDSTIAVTLVEVINPATLAEGPGDAAKIYLATKLTITDPGTVPIDGDVNINVAIVGSDDQSYVADLSDVSECTNFESGTFHLDPGESATGCVVFALPHGVNPAKVKYLPSAGFADDFGEWAVS